MKHLQCLDCEIIFAGDKEMEVLVEMNKHYHTEHNEIITNVTEEEKVVWMLEFTKRWNA